MGIDKNLFNLYEHFDKGEKNLISDVPGVKVGHVTLENSDKKTATGVTAIIPSEKNIFQNKLMAATYVINGFGKSVGLTQIDELGTIESPIIMTNTLSVGTALTATVKYMLEQNPDIGATTGTVNCVVTECNDSGLNDIRSLFVSQQNTLVAIKNANDIFEEGAVGAGTGMCCLGFKGGIGSSSRVLNLDNKEFVVGSLVLANFGKAGHLVIGGEHVGAKIQELSKLKEKGSIIMVIATNVPLNERQLKRVCKRASISLGRVGSFIGNGSGDIAIAFSTANTIKHYSEQAIIDVKMLHDDCLDPVFEATVETVEESIISALYHAKENLNGNLIKEIKALKDFI
ncbi:MAG: P1 family peptidase [Clostridia bacterium]